MIAIDSLSKRYVGTGHPALDGVTLQIPPASIFGLLGPNGAGKTTLISILAGIIRADSGSIRIDDRRLEAGHAGREAIGYCPQELAFYPGLSVRENLRLFADLSGGPDADAMAFAIASGDLSAHLGKRAGALSGGLKRRLNFAIALLARPRLLCLDEPTAGMDPQSRNFLLDAIASLRSHGVTVIYSTHYMEEIERLCDRVAILDRGRLLACDAVAALRKAPDERLEQLFLRLTHADLRDD